MGPNSAAEGHRESLLEALLESLREPLQLLLIVVGVLSAIWGKLRDAIAIFANSEFSLSKPAGGPSP